MKQIFWVIHTSLDQTAADICGFKEKSDNQHAIPAPLQQIDQVVVFAADFGRGLSRVPEDFSIKTLGLDEAQLISYLDISCLAAAAEPGSEIFAFGHSTKTVFYRALRHRLDLYSLAGVKQICGRTFDQDLIARDADDSLSPTMAQTCAGLGVPLSEALAALSDDDEDAVIKLGEIEALAGWLLCLLLENPNGHRLIEQSWARLADWIEEDPKRQHLLAFAHAADSYSKRAAETATADASQDDDLPDGAPA